MSMADDKLHQKLIDYIEDAHAMEQNVSRMLDSMISTTDDPEITEMLRHHKEETERQEQRLRERLDALGAGTSARKQAQTIAAALMKGAADHVRGDQAGKNARDGYTTEQLGTAIILPPQLEPHRERIEAILTPLPDPRAQGSPAR